MNAIIAEFRDSLPAILEGRDPVQFHDADWYLARLRSYAPDGLIAVSAERQAGEDELKVHSSNIAQP